MGKTKKSVKKSKKKHKHKSNKDKEAKRRHSKLKKAVKDEIKTTQTKETAVQKPKDKTADADDCFDIPVELMSHKSHAPETPEEYQQRQSHIRRVTDPVTGRIRLIKGDGEVLEEIVSKTRHAEINKAATRGDGQFFEENTIGGRQSKQAKR